MFFSSSEETLASSTVPVLMISESWFSRVKRIRAPVWERLMSPQAMTVCVMAPSTLKDA